MRLQIFIIVFLFPMLTNGQIEFGKYRLCFEMYWKCHTMIFLDLKKDSTYRFSLVDDVSGEESFGSWQLKDSMILLHPNTIPDTIQTFIFERKLSNSAKKYWWGLSNETIKNEDDNLLVLSNYFDPAKHKKVLLQQNGTWEETKTDEFGCVFYPGVIAEKIKFQVDNRIFELSTTKNEQPSLISITIKEDFKDLVFRTLYFNFVRIENNQMFIDVAEQGKKSKRLFFEKIRK